MIYQLSVRIAGDEFAGTLGFGIVEHLFGSSLFLDNSVIHEDYPVRRLACEAHFMRDDNHRHLFGGKVFYDLENLSGELGVESARRLVEEQNLRFESHCAGYRHALLLAAGKLAGIVVHLLAESDLAKQSFAVFIYLGEDSLAVLLEIRAALCMDFCGESDIFKRRILREQIEGLEHESYLELILALLLSGELIGITAVKNNAAVNVIEPLSAVSSILMQRSRVVFPLPDEPIIARTFFSSSEKLMPLRTSASPKDF